MYQISCDDLILHDVRLSDEYRVINPTCDLEVNAAGKLKFKMLPNHPYYDRINKLSSVITLTQDGEHVFSGRVLNDEHDFNNIKTIEVEGELAYLGDSNQRKAEIHNATVLDYFTSIINKHNTCVEKKKQFTVGSVTVKDKNDSLYRYSNYETTLDTIKDKLVKRLGGIIRIRHVGDIKYIDYIEDYENVNNQEINFGKNLLDLKKYVRGEDIVTAIIPLGARVSQDQQKTPTTEEVRLTIESINNGLDYVHDQDAVNLYGWIFKTLTWDNVTIPENLMRKAQEELAKSKMLSIQLELNAVDLHLMDVNIERIKLGDKIKVISKPHNIDKYMRVSKMHIDVERPESNTISLGFTTKSLTDVTNSDVDKEVWHVFEDYGIKSDIDRLKHEVKQTSAEIAKSSEQILMEVKSNYASKTDIKSINENFSTRLDIKDKEINMKFESFQNITENIEGQISSNQSLLEEYIRFKGALIELGKIGNVFVAKLSNDRLSFLQSNVEIAYISNNKLYITDAEIRNKLTIGNPTNGYFDFIPRNNGNLSLKWRAK